MKKNKQSQKNIKGKWFQSLLISDFEQTDIQNLIKTKQSRKQFPLLESLIQKNEDLSDSGKYDALMSKITYEKYLLIRNTVAYLCLLSFIISLTTFALNYQLDHKHSTTNNILMIFGIVNKLCQVIVYIYSKFQYGNFLKAIGDLKPNENYFQVEGYVLIIFKTVVLAIQPLFFIKDVSLNLRESYWTGDSYIYFYRDLNHYLYLVQFTVQFWLFFSILMENLKWASTRTHRICKMFGFFNGKIFIMKCLLATKGVTVAFVIVIAGLFFFATLINVSEIGLATYLKPEDFESVEAYQEAFYGIAYLSYYFNSYWNMIITMTTIGYGDMWVNSTLSRIILFFVAVYGAVVFPVFVVTLTNFFELSSQDQTVHDIIGLLDLKNQMKQEAGNVITTLVKLRIADKKNDQANIKLLSKKLMTYQAAFKTLKTQYNNIKAPDQIQDLSAKLEQLEQKFQLLERYFLPFMLNENPDFEEPEDDQLNVQILQKYEYEKFYTKQIRTMKQDYRKGHLDNTAIKTNFHQATNFGQTAGFAFSNRNQNQTDRLKEMIKQKHEKLLKDKQKDLDKVKKQSSEDSLQKKNIDKITHKNKDKDLPSSEEDEMKKFLQENIKHSNFDKELPSSEDEQKDLINQKINHKNLDKTLSLSLDETKSPTKQTQLNDIEDLLDSDDSREEEGKLFKQKIKHNNLNKSFEIYDEDDSNPNLMQDKIILQDLQRSFSISSEEDHSKDHLNQSQIMIDDQRLSINSQKSKKSNVSKNKKILQQSKENSTEQRQSIQNHTNNSPQKSPKKNIEDKPIINPIISTEESPNKSIKKNVSSQSNSIEDSSNLSNSQKKQQNHIIEDLQTPVQKIDKIIDEKKSIVNDSSQEQTYTQSNSQEIIQNQSLDISEDEEDVLNQSDQQKKNTSTEDLSKKRPSKISQNKDNLSDKDLHDILMNGGILEPLDNFKIDVEDQIKKQKKKKKIKNVYFIEINECEQCNDNNYLQHLIEE